MSKDFDPKNWFFPKDHIGQRSHAGHRAAYSLKDDPNVQWLRKMRFGATAKNRGGKLEVKPANELNLAGYMSYGHVMSDSGVHAHSSVWAAGPYIDRGRFVLATGFTPSSALVLYYYARGYGSTLTVGDAQTPRTDFNNRACNEYQVTCHITWNGKVFTRRYDFPIIGKYLGQSIYNIPLGDFRGSRIGKNESCHSHCSIYLDGDQYKHFVLLDDGNGGQPRRAPIVTLPFQLPHYIQVERVSPYNLIAFCRYFRPEYIQKPTVHPISSKPEDNPGLLFQSSSNDGNTWTRGDMGSWMQEFNETILTLDVDSRDDVGVIKPDVTNLKNSDIFNSAVNRIAFSVAPISPTRAVVYGIVPYIEVTAGPANAPETWNYRGKLKIGTINMSGNVSNITVLRDDTLANIAINWGDALAVKGGAVLKFHDTNTDVHYIFTPDGAGGTIGPAVGAQGWATGGTNGFKVGELDVVFYDSDNNYTLYNSKDNGLNWSKKGTVTKSGRVPPGGDIALYNYLIDFYLVTHLRENGVPAGAYQTAPWITDTKFTPPS